MIIEQKLGISENTDAIKMNLNALWSQLEFETNQSNISERRTENLIRKLHERDGERYSVDSNKYCSFEQSAKVCFIELHQRLSICLSQQILYAYSFSSRVIRFLPSMANYLPLFWHWIRLSVSTRYI